MNSSATLEKSLNQALTPAERLCLSRAEIVNLLQKDNQVLTILKPLVAGYTQTNPAKTLAIAAGIGAAIVVIKPWRLISLGGVLAILNACK